MALLAEMPPAPLDPGAGAVPGAFVQATQALLHSSNLQLKLTKKFIEALLAVRLTCPLTPFTQTLQQNVWLELVRDGVEVEGCFQCTLVVVCSNGQGYFKSVPREARSLMTGCFFSGARLKRREPRPAGRLRWLHEAAPTTTSSATAMDVCADMKQGPTDPDPAYYQAYSDAELEAMRGVVNLPATGPDDMPGVLFPLLQAFNIVILLEEDTRGSSRAHDASKHASSSSSRGAEVARPVSGSGGPSRPQQQQYDPAWMPAGCTPMTLRSDTSAVAAACAAGSPKHSSKATSDCHMDMKQDPQPMLSGSTGSGRLQQQQLQQQQLPVLDLGAQAGGQLHSRGLSLLTVLQNGGAQSQLHHLLQVGEGGNLVQLPVPPPFPHIRTPSGNWMPMPIQINLPAADAAQDPLQAPASTPEGTQSPAPQPQQVTTRTISAPLPSANQQPQAAVLLRNPASGSLPVGGAGVSGLTHAAPGAAYHTYPLHGQTQLQPIQLQPQAFQLQPRTQGPPQLQVQPQLQPIQLQPPPHQPQLQYLQLQGMQLQLPQQQGCQPQQGGQVLQLPPPPRQVPAHGQQLPLASVQPLNGVSGGSQGYVLVSAGGQGKQLVLTHSQNGGMGNMVQLQQCLPMQGSTPSGTFLVNAAGGLQLVQQPQSLQLQPHPQPIQLQLQPQSAPQAGAQAVTWNQLQMVQELQQGGLQVRLVGGAGGGAGGHHATQLLPFNPQAMAFPGAPASQDTSGVPPTKKLCLG